MPCTGKEYDRQIGVPVAHDPATGFRVKAGIVAAAAAVAGGFGMRAAIENIEENTPGASNITAVALGGVLAVCGAGYALYAGRKTIQACLQRGNGSATERLENQKARVAIEPCQRV